MTSIFRFLLIITQALVCLFILDPVAADQQDDPRVERIRQDLGYYSNIQSDNNSGDAEQQRKEQIRKSLGYNSKSAKKPAILPINPEAVTGNISKPIEVESTPPIADGNYITNIKFENVPDKSGLYPVSFGQIFVAGDLPEGYRLKAIGKDGHEIPLQSDVKARHQDGSVRHAVVSVLIQAKTGEIWLYKSVQKNTETAAKLEQADYKPAALQSSVAINIDGKKYTASLDKLSLDCEKKPSADHAGICQILTTPSTTKYQRIIHPKPINWLNGDIVQEVGIPVYFQDEEGVEHPHLMARFFVRKYLNSDNFRVDLCIENNWTYKPNPQNFLYDVDVIINHQKVYSQQNLIHYHHARWRKLFWTEHDNGIHVKHNIRYMIKTKVIPNYDLSLEIDPGIIERKYGKYDQYPDIPMRTGIVTRGMPQTGGRQDIGPLPIWAVHYLLTMDKRPKNITLAVGDMAGTWSVHYRDHNTDLPVSLSTYPYLTTHINGIGQGPHPIPRVLHLDLPAAVTQCEDCVLHLLPDVAHQPSMAFLPYVVTGDYYYLEELQFWANWNVFETAPAYRDLDHGLLRWQQPRGIAWSLRTLGQTAYITPDQHPLKNYFTMQVHYNMDYFNERYVTNTDVNKFGIFMSAGSEPQPWMQDFMTWSFGYMVDLGYSDALPILKWNAQFLINRFTNKDFCWLIASKYKLRVRNSDKEPFYADFKEIYKNNVPLNARICNAMPVEQLQAMQEPQRNETENRLTADCQCNSQRMVDSFYGKPSKIGTMVGYPDGDMGMPSILQPGLAMLVDQHIPMAKEAWQIFDSRSVKPNYAPNPVWDIVPRELPTN
jgi:hypothetical protein